jgi:hypothetical protein
MSPDTGGRHEDMSTQVTSLSYLRKHVNGGVILPTIYLLAGWLAGIISTLTKKATPSNWQRRGMLRGLIG